MAATIAMHPSSTVLGKPHDEAFGIEDSTAVAFRTAQGVRTRYLPVPYPPNTSFPLTLEPTIAGQPVDSIVSAVRSLVSAGEIRNLLTAHGAIYFRNLGLSSAEHFSQFANAIGWIPHEDIGNPVRRTVHAYNVANANEGPNTQPVYPHNEFGLSPHFPAYVLFYCASEPETGGETPINNSIVLYEELKKRHPEFIDGIEEKV